MRSEVAAMPLSGRAGTARLKGGGVAGDGTRLVI
jgi:hypothetical protein